MTRNRRSPVTLRRDLNDLVRGPDGKVAEAKVFAVGFKASMIYVFLKHTEMVVKDWMVLLVFCTALLAPDLLKKLIAMRAGKDAKP